MAFRGAETYGADIETVFAALCDPDTVRARFEASGATDVEIVRCEPDGDGFVIESVRTVTIDLPGFARRVLSPTNEMRQVERWSGPDGQGGRTATFTIEVDGVPVRTGGRIELRSLDGETEQVIEGEVDVKVPMIGKKLGSFLSGTARDGVADDLAFNKSQFG